MDYGTAGQALAVLLGADGHQLEVFERAPAPGPVGAGFLLQPSGLQVLWNMGLLPQALAHGAPVRRLYGDTPCGRAVMDMQCRDLDARLTGVGMQRGALFTLLREAWPQHAQLHVDTQITAIDHAGVRVQDQRGHWHGPYDLIIAADGSASTLRAQAQGTQLDRVYPWGGAVVSVAARRLAVRGRIAPALYRRTQDDRSAAGGHASGRRHPAAKFFLEPAVQPFCRVEAARHCRLAR